MTGAVIQDQLHVPVLLNEVVDALAPRDGGLYVDGTFGAGGYSAAILDAADCRVWGIDRDPSAVARGSDLSKKYDGRFDIIEGCFGDLVELLEDRAVDKVDGVALDLGVSSMQIDDAQRGFSFRHDGPLDMRMASSGQSAADLVNSAAESTLADIIYTYGEERRSRRVAHAIVAARAEAPITRTGQLAEIVRSAVPQARDGIDPATRTFQALRIYINDELSELDRGLAGAETVLAPGGRLAVVAFHSLEDRSVKRFLRERSGSAGRPSRHLPESPGRPAPTFILLQRRPKTPSEREIATNPRARSARLRSAERTEAPPWPTAESRRQ